VVRVFIGEAGVVPMKVWVIETDMDDMAVEIHSAAADRIQAAGALTYSTFQFHMKKGRLGLRLFVVAAGSNARAGDRDFLKETTTFGLLRERGSKGLEAPGGCLQTSLALRVKEGYDRHGTLLSGFIEFEDVRKIGDRKGCRIGRSWSYRERARS
jgi:uncharacterized protein (DUF111 family)